MTKTVAPKVLITQDCKNECGAKVHTLQDPGMAVPEPRLCVRCLGK